MYSNAGYLREKDADIVEEHLPLSVTGCGVYRLKVYPKMETIRPCGRKDYQLLYVNRGCIWMKRNNRFFPVTEGKMILYLPGELQHYYYLAKDHSEVYWVHFTGTKAGELVAQMEASELGVIDSGNSQEYVRLMNEMIAELQMKRLFFEQILVENIRKLCWLCMRKRKESGSDKVREEIAEAVSYFNTSYRDQIRIEEYAREKHQSVCWFIRCFKQYMGVPPMQYLTSVRMNRARELLNGSRMTIGEIGKSVGYENPLYFSRIFKQYMGVSPEKYRKNSQEEEHDKV